MRYTRQSRIIELISSEDISTQEKLAQRLKEEGFNVTQATVSRDIKELQLVKLPGKTGKNCYALPPENESEAHTKFRKVLKETILSIVPAENIIVIRTLSGCAGAACEAIDAVIPKEVLGTLAGDNTILLVVDKKENVNLVLSLLKEHIA